MEFMNPEFNKPAPIDGPVPEGARLVRLLAHARYEREMIDSDLVTFEFLHALEVLELKDVLNCYKLQGWRPEELQRALKLHMKKGCPHKDGVCMLEKVFTQMYPETPLKRPQEGPGSPGPDFPHKPYWHDFQDWVLNIFSFLESQEYRGTGQVQKHLDGMPEYRTQYVTPRAERKAALDAWIKEREDAAAENLKAIAKEMGITEDDTE